MAKILNIYKLVILMDSQFAKQFEGTFCTKEPRIEAYTKAVQEGVRQWPNVQVMLISKRDNREADALVGIGGNPCPDQRR